MGKRVAVSIVEQQPPHHDEQQQRFTPNTTRSIRKRKRAGITATVGKTPRLNITNNYDWHENDDEDSSSNDATAAATTPPARNQSSKQANNSSILINASLNASIGGGDYFISNATESPKPVYTLRPSVVNGTILFDLTGKPWRLGRPIGKGNFGEIFLASDNTSIPVSNENAKFVVKIEPHSNGPLFVEIHCLMNTAKFKTDNIKDEEEQEFVKNVVLKKEPIPNSPPSGIPDYIASGSHHFGDARYRFLVLQRFDRDLHTLIKNCVVHQKSLLTLAIHIVNVLENLHDKGYCHNDVKAQNLMISKCKYFQQQAMAATFNGGGKSSSKKSSSSLSTTTTSTSSSNTLKTMKYDEHYEEKQQTTDSGNSSEQETNEDELEDEKTFVLKRNLCNEEDEEDEDFDDGATTNSNNSNSVDMYQTPINKNHRMRRGRTNAIEFSGSNPVRSCRREKPNSIYDEMVKSHYLRPTKRISYSEFFNEDGGSSKGGDSQSIHIISSEDETEELTPACTTRRATTSSKKISSTSLKLSRTSSKRLTRRQEKLRCNEMAKEDAQQRARRAGGAYVASTQTSTTTATTNIHYELITVEEERIFLIDFGLASKFMDNNMHRPFVMDQRRAHDGTLEFTSRDAHLGAHSRRSDLECLGYNLLYWSQGYLPWRDAAVQQNQEKVHRSKELLMTDVREMLKQIYGKSVPKYLGEFLHHVGQLAYQERPDYVRYRKIFMRAYQQVGGNSCDSMQLDSHDILRTCVRVKEETENTFDIFELNNKHNNNIMKNATLGTPFHDHSFSNRVSPKNLRSKSDKKNPKKKKFSWAEVLSQDPDQIARERAVKEFEREAGSLAVAERSIRRYDGKPTYAILDIQQRLKMCGRLVDDESSEEDDEEEEEDGDEEEEQQDTNDDDELSANENEVNDVGEDEEQEDEMDVDNDETYKIEGDDEDEEEEDDGEEVAEEEEDEEEEEEEEQDSSSDTDTTDNSEKSGRNKCTRTRNKKKKASTNSTRNKVRRILPKQGKKGATPVKFSTKTRSASVKAVVVVATKPIQNTGQKRGGRTESSLDELENQQQLHNGGHLLSKSDGGSGGVGYKNNSSSRPLERRTRRLLIKTDAAAVNNELDDESNSNFSPEMTSLYNVWKKLDNESIYCKGRNVDVPSSMRHGRK